ncbi:MAG: hypothetical protein QOI06_3311 [Nocardioidaceae bacterium]|nr:hypothetical protein [Nocardioidaceae bacterium]
MTEVAPIRPLLASLAAVTWMVSAAMFLALEAIAAAAFRPRYSYANNFISDLGVPTPGMLDGHYIDSTRAALMNFNFIADGVLFVTAAVLIFRATAALGDHLRTAFLVLAVVHGLGMTLVGTFHGSSEAIADGTAKYHSLGAVLAICGANAAFILVGRNARRLGASVSYGYASSAIGMLGIVSAVVLVASGLDTLPGVWERGAAYSIMIWEIMTGSALLLSLNGRARNAAAECDQVRDLQAAYAMLRLTSASTAAQPDAGSAPNSPY